LIICVFFCQRLWYELYPSLSRRCTWKKHPRSLERVPSRYSICSSSLYSIRRSYSSWQYLSIAVQDVPNVCSSLPIFCVHLTIKYFMYYGPHGPTGHGSGAPMIEVSTYKHRSVYIKFIESMPVTRCFLRIIKKMQMENITCITVKEQAVSDFNEHRELYLKRTAWNQACSSWFRPSLSSETCIPFSCTRSEKLPSRESHNVPWKQSSFHWITD
jgi:hypothetical protein